MEENKPKKTEEKPEGKSAGNPTDNADSPSGDLADNNPSNEEENNLPNQNKENLPEEFKEKIIPRIVEEEMKQSYVDYAMSVIIGRALPDARDGLKPVHRRILFAMNEMGMFHNKPSKKSARIVGEVLGKYHPHGDTAVYDSLVRMAQDFSLRYPLVQGQGNFGSVDGDRPAAMRYTEAKLSKISEELLKDIEKETVKFVPNFDETLKEPSVLPAKLPNLLINGSSGIAVGMATNMPPHNIGEVIDAAVKLIESPETEIKELMNYIKGPDFPTAGIICNQRGILNIYKTGKGHLTVRAKTEIQEKANKQRIIVSEIPYMVNKAQLIEAIADLVRRKKLNGISDLRDESNKEGIRVVIELKQGTNPNVLLNQLYKHTRLQTTFGVMMIALIDNEPKTLNLKQIIKCYIHHRQLIVRKRTEFDLKKASARSHVLEGIIIALDNIDKTIEMIKKSSSAEEAKNTLILSFSLTKEQAIAILDIKLQKLTSMEQDKIKEEQKSLLRLIEELRAVLASEQKILDIIKNELIELKEKYNDSRKTEIIDEEAIFEAEDLIEDTESLITITRQGYIKRISPSFYRQQRRGGKGIIAADTKEEDFVEHLFMANTHNYILFFTDKGKVYWLKVYEIPEAGRQAMGKAIINLLHLDNKEKITSHIPVRKFDENHFLVMATKKGIIKKTNLMEYSRPRKSGIIAINLDEGDNLINSKLTDGTKNIILATKKGLAAKFRESDIRPIGRTGKGVIGIRLNENDSVVGMETGADEDTLLTITQNGYGKRSKISYYRLINRGGKGVINIKATDRNKNIVSIKSVNDSDELMFISKNGIMIRTPVKDISVFGRNTQGIRLMKLSENDFVVAAAKVIRD